MTNLLKAKDVFMAMKKDTKTRRILQHLIDHESISSMEAFRLYNATRLSAVIYVLKNTHGIEIETVDKVGKDGTRYAEYRLA